MKQVLVDLYKTKEPFSGLGQFSFNFYESLIASPTSNFEWTFLHPPGFDQKMEGHQFVETSFQNRYLPFLNKKYDIWHSLQQFPSHFPSKSSHHILTIHDLNFLEEKSEAKANSYLKRLQNNVNSANTLTAISAYTKSVAEKHLNLSGKTIHVIHNGIQLKAFS